MANIWRGFKRILWIISISASIVAWIILYSTADLEEEKKINNAGAVFISWLDEHYFKESERIGPDEWLLRRLYQNEIGNLMEMIELNVKSDSIESWPYMWQLSADIDKTIFFDIDGELAIIRWQESLRKAILKNEEEIKRTFPDIKFDDLLIRYGAVDNPNKFRSDKHILPESYFKVSYQRPYGHMAALFLLGTIPFIAIWLFSFIIKWVVDGFKG